MEKWVKRTIMLGLGLFLTNKQNPSVIRYYPQKTRISGDEERFFRRSYPERVGVKSGRLLAMIKALERERRANIHSMVVIKDGVVICECSHPGYDVNMWHLSHSMSKTLTGMAIGVLVDEGKLSLDERLVDIFPEVIYKDSLFDKITVHHLLSMTAGVKFSEAGSVSETHWTEAFFESGVAFEPGTQFSYNSMNTYILARIAVIRSGMSLVDFVKKRILEPLEIENFFWECGPEGVEKGGWGVYMSAESWAKLGVMMLDGGVFRGKRLLSKEWVKLSTATHMTTPDIVGPYNYGYQMWVSRKNDSFLFNGMLGQNVWVCPKNNLVVSLNSGNNELFQNSPAMAVIEKYLSYDLSSDLHDSCFSGDLLELREAEEHFFESRHWVRPYEERRGLSYALGFKSKRPYPEEWDQLIGRYQFAKNNIGILPLIVRVMQNNMKGSLDGIEFRKDGERIFFIFTESGESYEFEVGFYDFKTTVLNYHGEKYIVRVIGEAMEDEDRNMLFKLELLFPETPNTRMIKFSFEEDGSLLMRMSEMPNHKIADVYLEEMTVSNPALAFVFNLFEKRVGGNIVEVKLRETFSPRLIGARVGGENYTEIMDRERERLRANEKTISFVDTVAKRFFHDVDEELEEKEKKKSGFSTFISDIVDRFRQKFPKKSSTPEEKKTKALPEDKSQGELPEGKKE